MSLGLVHRNQRVYSGRMIFRPFRRRLADDAKESIHITTSDTVTDRKSRFIGRATRIRSTQDVEQMLEHVRGLKAVKKSSHPAMYAWRFHKNNRVEEGSADDGEAGAGEILLTLLRQSGRSDVLVTVTRFYGGKPLGSDRFRHIRNVAIEALKQLDNN